MRRGTPATALAGKWRLEPALAALLLLIGSAASAATATDWAPLAEELDALRKAANVPAMGLAIVADGRPSLVRSLGAASPDTPFRWGSITKSFTALAALTAMREYRLAPELPVRELLGSCCYTNAWADTHPVRLRQLLELAAGFPDLRAEEFGDNTPRSLEDALQRGSRWRRTRWPPGLQHSYSNVAPGLTAAVIEHASGKAFKRYLSSRVLEPLGMTGASLDPVPGLPGGHRADGRTLIPYWNMTFAGFGALNASTRELSRFVATLVNHGRLDNVQVFEPAVVDDLFRPQATLGARGGLEVTYAAGIYGWVRDGHVFWGHGGDADGYLARYGVLRDHGRGYAVAINTDNPPLLRRLVGRIERALLADLPRHPARSRNDPDLAMYVGTYYPSNARFSLERWASGALPRAAVELDGERLSFVREGRRTELTALGEGRFRREEDPATTVVFVRDEQGALYLQGELGNYVNLSNTPCPAFLAPCESAIISP